MIILKLEVNQLCETLPALHLLQFDITYICDDSICYPECEISPHVIIF